MPRENIEQYKGVFIFAQQVDNEISSIFPRVGTQSMLSK